MSILNEVLPSLPYYALAFAALSFAFWYRKSYALSRILNTFVLITAAMLHFWRTLDISEVVGVMTLADIMQPFAVASMCGLFCIYLLFAAADGHINRDTATLHGLHWLFENLIYKLFPLTAYLILVFKIGLQ